MNVATVYEAAGRTGLIDVDLIRIVPGSSAHGPARTVRCGQGDNLMVHAVMAEAQPGDILVLTMPEPEPVALLGELLATQAIARGVAGVLVDAAVRDADELAAMGLPIWARWIRVRGARKEVRGTIDGPVMVGGARIAPGDLVVLDGDGACVVEKHRVDEVLAAADARERKERAKRERLQAGELSYDIDGLRP